MIKLTYSKDEEQVFITNVGKYHRSGICVHLDEITEKDILELLKKKRELLWN